LRICECRREGVVPTLLRSNPADGVKTAKWLELG